jgi:trehalose 6-phosphate phosphatase
MTPHWTEYRSELQRWLVSCPRVLVGCDFDGTLAPIVAHARDAALPPKARRALERMVKLPGVMVAIISGRALGDLRDRIGIHAVLYAGNHGLEMSGPGGVETIAPVAAQAQERLKEVVSQLTPMLERIPGVWIEDKQFTASVHYRMASIDHHSLVGQIVNTALRGIEELTPRAGKCVWDIRPSARWDKGAALTLFIKQCAVPNRAVAFFGDDLTDRDVFAVVPEGWTGVVGDLALPEARMRVRDPGEMADLLAWMADVRLSAF